MAINDGYLRAVPSDVDPDDGRLHDPTAGDGAGAYTLAADVGAFVLAGQAAGLLVGRRLTADAAAFVESGQPADLLAGRRLVAAAGTFTESGQAVDLKVGRRLDAAAGTFSEAGQPATLTVGRVASVDVGAFVVTGQSAELAAAHTLTAAPGAIALAGMAVELRPGVGLVAEAGAFVSDGQPAALTYTPSAPSPPPIATGFRRSTPREKKPAPRIDHRMVCEPCEYVCRGQSASLYVAQPWRDEEDDVEALAMLSLSGSL